MKNNIREIQPLRCVVCNSDDGLVDCAYKSDTEVCPSSATHCLSTVTYFISEKLDLSFGELVVLSLAEDLLLKAIKI